MHEEKRNLPRYAVRLMGQYELLSALPGECIQDSEVLDVGLRGCRMSTGRRSELSGLRVTVRLVLARETVSISGTIVWTRPARL